MSRKSAPPIEIASLSNSQDQNEQHIVRDIVDNAVVADAYAVAICRSAQLLAVPRARVLNERFSPASDSQEGLMRWWLRVGAYAFLLTTDRYPPFRID